MCFLVYFFQQLLFPTFQAPFIAIQICFFKKISAGSENPFMSLIHALLILSQHVQLTISFWFQLQEAPSLLYCFTEYKQSNGFKSKLRIEIFSLLLKPFCLCWSTKSPSPYIVSREVFYYFEHHFKEGDGLPFLSLMYIGSAMLDLVRGFDITIF